MTAPIDAPPRSGVRLLRDDHGVPHIVADGLEAAHWGMGYCHALDRGLQMMMMRVLGQGRAAELLDGSDEMVEVDRFFRRMGWRGRMAEQLELIEPRTLELVRAYCDGVDAKLSRGVPWELRLMGVRHEPWTIEDCLLLVRMTGYLTLAQSQAEVERLYLEMLQGGLSDELLATLFPVSAKPEEQHVERSVLEQVRLDERVVPEHVRWACAAPRAMASNNWVVAPSRSRSGHALFANDPHLEVNRLPNVWVEQVIELPDDTVFTANMPGLPGALVGRNHHLAWGATYTFMDAVDSWVEQCEGGRFRRDDDGGVARWMDFSVRRETILRKKGAPVDVVFYENAHGVLEGEPGDGYRLTTRWAPGDSGAATLNAAAAMWAARTVTEGMAAVGGIETAWNWVLADTAGHIGYQMSGRCPLRHPDANGFSPMPGWDPSYDWRGWAAAEQLPRCLDPDEGYIVTANQDLNRLGQLSPINMPMGDYRARRIAQRLEEQPNDRGTFGDIQMDVWSIQADEMMAVLEPVLPESGSAADLLRGWDRCYQPSSRGAALFEAFYRELIVEVFGGVLGGEVLDHLQEETGTFIDFYAQFDRVLVEGDRAWLGERDLGGVYRAAFDRVAERDHGEWGQTNHVTLRHILFGGKLPRWLGFDRGPIPLRGGRATPHQGQVYQNGGRATSFAPSLRLVADMGERTLFTAMAGGPSDRRFSRYYVSGLEDWLAGRFKEMRRSS